MSPAWLPNHNPGMNYIVPKSADELLATETEQLERIKTDAGVAENIWQAFYLPMLRAFAEQVQTLPFSKECFSGERGALQFGLLSAMLALRVARQQVFLPKERSEGRRSLEPQFYFAALVAMLATGVVVVTQNVHIETAAGDSDYHPLVCPVPIKTWLSYNPTAQMTWRVDAAPYSSAEAAAIAARFIPTGILNDFDLRVSLAIYGAIAPSSVPNGVESTLAMVVRQCMLKVIHFQIEEEKKVYHPHSPGNGTLNATADSLAQKTVSVAPVAVSAAPSAPNADAGLTAANLNGPAAVQVTQTPAPVLAGEPTLDDALAALSKAPTALKQWFQAICHQEKFSSYVGQISFEPKGVIVPITLVGKLGLLSGQAVKTLMIDAEVVVELTEDRRNFVLLPALKPFFSKPKE